MSFNLLFWIGIALAPGLAVAAAFTGAWLFDVARDRFANRDRRRRIGRLGAPPARPAARRPAAPDPRVSVLGWVNAYQEQQDEIRALPETRDPKWIS